MVLQFTLCTYTTPHFCQFPFSSRWTSRLVPYEQRRANLSMVFNSKIPWVHTQADSWVICQFTCPLVLSELHANFFFFKQWVEHQLHFIKEKTSLVGASNNLTTKLLNSNARSEGCGTHALCRESLDHSHGSDSNQPVGSIRGHQGL